MGRKKEGFKEKCGMILDINGRLVRQKERDSSCIGYYL